MKSCWTYSDILSFKDPIYFFFSMCRKPAILGSFQGLLLSWTSRACWGAEYRAELPFDGNESHFSWCHSSQGIKRLIPKPMCGQAGERTLGLGCVSWKAKIWAFEQVCPSFSLQLPASLSWGTSIRKPCPLLVFLIPSAPVQAEAFG